jgi:hypothetical protein
VEEKAEKFVCRSIGKSPEHPLSYYTSSRLHPLI